MITIPPVILTLGLLVIAAPTNPAVVPSIRKMIDKPALNASELIITARRLVVPSLRPSILTPEISEMYPGTSGNTHGERNESMPAANEIAMLSIEMPWPFIKNYYLATKRHIKHKILICAFCAFLWLIFID